MRTGRPKKDKDLNKLHGNPGKRKPKKSKRILTETVKFGMPHGLPEAVRLKVRQAILYLYENGISKASDRSAFARYCQHLHMAENSYQIAKDTIKGDALQDKAFQRHLNHSKAALRFEEHFGLTPQARGKVGPEGKDEEIDPLAEFQKKGKKLEAVK